MADVRRLFHDELNELTVDVVRLAALASESVQAGTAAVLELDLNAAEQVINDDAALDELTHSIEDRCFLLMARQQPMAVDLRTLVSMLRVIHELERVGDLMVNVAKATRRLYPQQLDPKVRVLIDRMRHQAVAQLQMATDTFADRDPAKASALEDMDDVMDDLQKELYRTIFGATAHEEAEMQRAVQVALLGRYFERIADHAVNIGERVTYMVTGAFSTDS